MELLFISLLEWAKGQGYASFSLGQAPLTGIGEHNDDPRIEQALRRLSAYFKRFINFGGLHSFKEKFNPRWEPRYVVYRGVASLPGHRHHAAARPFGWQFSVRLFEEIISRKQAKNRSGKRKALPLPFYESMNQAFEEGGRLFRRRRASTISPIPTRSTTAPI